MLDNQNFRMMLKILNNQALISKVQEFFAIYISNLLHFPNETLLLADS